MLHQLAWTVVLPFPEEESRGECVRHTLQKATLRSKNRSERQLIIFLECEEKQLCKLEWKANALLIYLWNKPLGTFRNHSQAWRWDLATSNTTSPPSIPLEFGFFQADAP
ncbi:hypothetical protein NECAME_04448 [Necator americanus]|uniref:Uncharacterized protein n=1 Tax=Necator americanus TaxID=51031 RepID=W2SSQ4_NECAM|nr:hypothetical protein NECAME_04448 [Necator americanus]ETN72548.1 hypothetical protein NECAME_04448 [Necator americanus]